MHYFSKYLLSTIYVFSGNYLKTFFKDFLLEIYFDMIYGNALHSDLFPNNVTSLVLLELKAVKELLL